MPPPALTDDLVDEVLLRFPPEEPELLVRATLVCKRWFRVISDPRFRRRFRELHRAAPMLGFFCADYWGASRFVLVSSTPLPHAIRGDWRAVDVRHGRVLLNTVARWDDFTFGCSDDLLVWNPVTGDHHRLPKLQEHMYPHPYPYCCDWTAAVLCAKAEGGCDHLDCHRGPFLVVFLCTSSREAFASVYSSETAAWSGPASSQLRRAQEISVIRLPQKPYRYKCIALMATVDGGLGFAAMHGSTLDLWSGVPGTKGYVRWAQSQAIDLKTICTLPASLETVCCIDGVAAILRGMDQTRTYVIIDLKSIIKIKKIFVGRESFPVPYMSFYIPGTDLLSLDLSIFGIVIFQLVTSKYVDGFSVENKK
ncbi:hypothetical protein HU200_017900 [Digitaria exilis]|uniref:F-box domain-containing protein n=1 Tax=Digitaria exilis TaxID=1010633 RepID=A0A835F5H6_9POAL|nr:hypothetical protein HU200_017900 [Digitaria exilis]